MSWFSSLLGKAAGETISGTLNGVGDAALKFRSAVTGEMTPDKIAELQLKAMELDEAAKAAQTKINEIEAASPSFFVAGWRPAAGWLGVIGLAYASIVQPILTWMSVNLGLTPPPAIDTGALITVLVQMLGFGAYRTYEKAKGVEGNR